MPKKRLTEQQRIDIIVESETFSGSLEKFCLMKGITSRALRAWKQRYREKEKKGISEDSEVSGQVEKVPLGYVGAPPPLAVDLLTSALNKPCSHQTSFLGLIPPLIGN